MLARTLARLSRPRWFGTLLVIFCLIRGLALAGALMPFHGWDEYQHLAVSAYVGLHDRMPRIWVDSVPTELFDLLLSHPHPQLSARDLAGIGARNYRGELWDPDLGRWIPEGEPVEPFRLVGPGLYQSQHGPLFYHLAARIMDLPLHGSLLLWADLLRSLNVVLGALAAGLWYALLARWLEGTSLQHLAAPAALLAAANPLVAFNHARVANDALAVLLGSAALYGYLHWVRSRTGPPGWIVAGLLGLLVGLATLAKSLAMILIPLFLAGLVRKAGSRKLRALTLGMIFLLGYLLAAGAYHARTYAELGTPTGMAESVLNRRFEVGWTDLAAGALRLDPRQILGVMVHETLHSAGWSLQASPKWIRRSYGVLLDLGLLSLLIGLIVPETRRRLLETLGGIWELLLLELLMGCGFLYHMTHSTLSHGHSMTNPWYGVLTFPALFTLVLLGFHRIAPRLATGALALLLGLMALAYYHGLLVQLPAIQAPGVAWSQAVHRAREHHQLLCFPLWPLLALELTLLVTLAVTTIRASLLRR